MVTVSMGLMSHNNNGLSRYIKWELLVLCNRQGGWDDCVQASSSSSSSCSRSVPWLGKGFSMLFPHLPILRYTLPDGTLPVVRLSNVSLVSSISFPFVAFLGGDM